MCFPRKRIWVEINGLGKTCMGTCVVGFTGSFSLIMLPSGDDSPKWLIPAGGISLLILTCGKRVSGYALRSWLFSWFVYCDIFRRESVGWFDYWCMSTLHSLIHHDFTDSVVIDGLDALLNTQQTQYAENSYKSRIANNDTKLMTLFVCLSSVCVCPSGWWRRLYVVCMHVCVWVCGCVCWLQLVDDTHWLHSVDVCRIQRRIPHTFSTLCYSLMGDCLCVGSRHVYQYVEVGNVLIV